MHASQMFALAQLDMAEAQAKARHARAVSECRPESPWPVLRTRLRRLAPRPRAVAPAAAPLRPAG
jgi:hypothetical protein